VTRLRYLVLLTALAVFGGLIVALSAGDRAGKPLVQSDDSGAGTIERIRPIVIVPGQFAEETP
jgi:hypothetical protein